MAEDRLIRACGPGDVEDLLKLFTEVAEERLWIGTEPGFDRAAYRRGWDRVLAGDGGAMFVALEAGRIAGTLGVHPDAEHGCAIAMLVQREHRHKGIGSDLLREAIRWARERDETMLSLIVFPHNAAAIALYQKFGFVEKQRYQGFKRRQNGEVWDGILMVLTLPRVQRESSS
jgi:putative acetyltransferase